MKDSPQTVLLSLVGTTPAVLTETVWAMATGPERVVPDRIVAVTTRPGAELLRRKLFSDGHWGRMKERLMESGCDLEGKLRFGDTGNSIRVFTGRTEEIELDDIRTKDDSAAVAEFFMELIRGFTENEAIRLIVSIAGGRKTTSALLHSVMTLLGRAEDTITHILVDDPWMTQPDFLYPGCEGSFKDTQTDAVLNSADATLTIAEVPFVPLRYLFKKELDRSAGSYLELMTRLQKQSISVKEDLFVQVDTRRGVINVSGKEIALSPNEFLFYLFFAKHAQASKSPVEAYATIVDDLTDLANEFKPEDDFNHWSYKAGQKILGDEDLRKWASSIRKKIEIAGFDEVEVNLLVPKRARLVIDLPPEAIEIV